MPLTFWCDSSSVLFELDFDTIHRAGIKTHAMDALSRLESVGEDYTDINDNNFVAVLDPMEDTRKATKDSPYTVCQICDNNERDPGNMMPKVQYHIHGHDPQWDKPL